MQKNIMTLERHFLEQQRKFPLARGEFTKLLTEIGFAAKVISREVNRAGLGNILGDAGVVNIQGEEVKKLDLMAQKMLVSTMDHLGILCGMASEEEDTFIEIPDSFPTGSYALNMDPLDGSSNIDVNVSIGTIFSIHRKISDCPRGDAADCLQAGSKQVAAGYVLYGSSTMLIYTSGHGVYGFTLDPCLGEFLLSHEAIRIPGRGRYYSINEGYADRWFPWTRNYINHAKKPPEAGGRGMSLRYVGSLVADFHRNLFTGGIFIYPGDTRADKGKLRLLFEAAPLAFVAEQAGGRATDGRVNIMDIQPENLHQRTPLIIGSADDVDDALRFIREETNETSHVR
ncbi:class 1 fructose-bisphosphatase [bacterium]|nr:class 1 fructose-bisphosphatase [candidate division CSSED10-310 bacterium]